MTDWALVLVVVVRAKHMRAEGGHRCEHLAALAAPVQLFASAVAHIFVQVEPEPRRVCLAVWVLEGASAITVSSIIEACIHRVIHSKVVLVVERHWKS